MVEGNSAVLLDLRDASNRDMTRAIIFVLGGVFVVLVLLLRALVAPIYLILTILLSYAATLGVVRLLFVDILGAAGIVWWVPMFMFVMLVALGMDYNIFLIGRVKEEVAPHGTRAGTRLALARTGRHHHLGRHHHGRHLRQHAERQHPGAAADRVRGGLRRAARHLRGAHHPGAGHHRAAGQMELVAAQMGPGGRAQQAGASGSLDPEPDPAGARSEPA